jgi:Asp/Glu/hydantoin racemase
MSSGKTIGLVHAVIPAIAPMREVLARTLPQLRVLNLLDEGLLAEAERQGGPVGDALERMVSVIELHQRAGVDAVMMTCTAYSSVVPELQRRFPLFPIMAVDQTMVERAVQLGTKIGVLATGKSGIDQQSVLLREAAARAGKQIEIIGSLHPAALAAVQRGDRETHDKIVLAALPALIEQADVVLLAQVSMSPLIAKLPPNLGKPVLSSPQLAAEKLAEVLFGVRAGAS